MASRKKEPDSEKANRSNLGEKPDLPPVVHGLSDGRGGKGEEPQDAIGDWQQVFDIVPHFVAVLSPDMKVIRLNRAACETLGKKSEDAVGKRCCEIVHGSHKPVLDCPGVDTI
jgi:PAS domain-containing protein